MSAKRRGGQRERPRSEKVPEAPAGQDRPNRVVLEKDRTRSTERDALERFPHQHIGKR